MVLSSSIITQPKICGPINLLFVNATTHAPLESLRKRPNLLCFIFWLLCLNALFFAGLALWIWSPDQMCVFHFGLLWHPCCPPGRVMGTWTGHDSTLRKEVEGGVAGGGIGFA